MKPESTFDTICRLNHEINRIQGIDRTSFFGRLEIVEYFCQKTHEAIGERWRKFGRYGNVVSPNAMKEALQMVRDEAQFTVEEFEAIRDWMKGQGTPDQACGAVVIDWFLGKYDEAKA